MTPAQARASLRRLLHKDGQQVIIRRTNVSPAAPTEITVWARITGYTPEELASGVQQAARRAIVAAEDFEGSGFPLPLRGKGSDAVIVGNSKLTIQTVDDATRRIGGVLIAYELQIMG